MMISLTIGKMHLPKVSRQGNFADSPIGGYAFFVKLSNLSSVVITTGTSSGLEFLETSNHSLTDTKNDDSSYLNLPVKMRLIYA